MARERGYVRPREPPPLPARTPRAASPTPTWSSRDQRCSPSRAGRRPKGLRPSPSSRSACPAPPAFRVSRASFVPLDCRRRFVDGEPFGAALTSPLFEVAGSDGGLAFSLIPRAGALGAPVLAHPVEAALLVLPTLKVLDARDRPVGDLAVEPAVHGDKSLGLGVNPVHRHVDVRVVGVSVESIDDLVAREPQQYWWLCPSTGSVAGIAGAREPPGHLCSPPRHRQLARPRGGEPGSPRDRETNHRERQVRPRGRPRAIARIEYIQGWQGEDRGLYRVREDGGTERTRPRDEQERKPSVRARDLEERTGERSAERLAIEEAAPAIRKDEVGARYTKRWRSGDTLERKGSGAILWVGDRPVKASSAGRDCSMSALEKRLGEFEPAREAAREVSRTRAPEPIMPRAPGWQQYIEARGRHYSERSVRREQLAGRHREDRQRMTSRHRAERADIFRRPGRVWDPSSTRPEACSPPGRRRSGPNSGSPRAGARWAGGRLRTVPKLRGMAASKGSRPCAGMEASRERAGPDRRADPRASGSPRHPGFRPRIEGWRVDYCRVGESGSPAFTNRGKESTSTRQTGEKPFSQRFNSAHKSGTRSPSTEASDSRRCASSWRRSTASNLEPRVAARPLGRAERIRTRGLERPPERRQPDGPEPGRPGRRLSRSGPER